MINENYSNIDPGSLHKILNEKENDYLSKLKEQLGDSFIENKIRKMNHILSEIDKKITISVQDFEEIKKLAISKGGFIKNSYRREFYKKAFKLDNDFIHLLYHNDNIFQNKYMFIKEFKSNDFNQEKLNSDKKKKTEYIIEVDIKRTISNSFFKSDKEVKELDVLKQKLTIFLKKFILVNKDYHYYQGFHDIAMYIYLIFYNYEHLAVQMLQRVSEFFLKDYLVEEEDNNSHFKFETVFKVVKALISKFNNRIGEFLENNTTIPDPFFCLPWVITLFTHDISDLFFVLRLFDYFLFSHPSAIYHLSSNVNNILFTNN